MKINLYHASKNYFEMPDLSKARDYKDFGRGFYLTTNLEQALSWAVRGLEENNINSFGYVYQYDFEINNAKILNCLELKVYNKEWVDTIAWYRNNVESHMKYELIWLASQKQPKQNKVAKLYSNLTACCEVVDL